VKDSRGARVTAANRKGKRKGISKWEGAERDEGLPHSPDPARSTNPNKNLHPHTKKPPKNHPTKPPPPQENRPPPPQQPRPPHPTHPPLFLGWGVFFVFFWWGVFFFLVCIFVFLGCCLGLVWLFVLFICFCWFDGVVVVCEGLVLKRLLVFRGGGFVLVVVLVMVVERSDGFGCMLVYWESE